MIIFVLDDYHFIHLFFIDDCKSDFNVLDNVKSNFNVLNNVMHADSFFIHINLMKQKHIVVSVALIMKQEQILVRVKVMDLIILLQKRRKYNR